MKLFLKQLFLYKLQGTDLSLIYKMHGRSSENFLKIYKGVKIYNVLK